MSRIGFVILIAACLASCGKSPQVDISSRPIGAPLLIGSPLGLPAVPVPADNPPTIETVALGRRLFYDPKLSLDGTLSCATCHTPDLGFADGRPVSSGVGAKIGTRNAPTVLNAAYSPLQFWDGRAKSLEEQSAGPIANPIEMNHQHPEVLVALNADPSYVKLFETAFGPGPITLTKLQKSIASFERTLLSANSPFDRYMYGHEATALSQAAIRGLEIFRDPKRGNCEVCHTINDGYALFTDGKFHNIGAGIDLNGELTDLGRYEQTRKEADKGAFKTPTLRNVARTAPYLHDGSKKTLKAVVDFYVGGGNSNPNLDKEIKELKLNGKERADLVAFLEALTGEIPPNSGRPEIK